MTLSEEDDPTASSWARWSKSLTTQKLSSQEPIIPSFQECYMSVLGGNIVLVCKRRQCNKGAFCWSEVIPNGALPEFVVMRRAAHLATHGAEI